MAARTHDCQGQLNRKEAEKASLHERLARLQLPVQLLARLGKHTQGHPRWLIWISFYHWHYARGATTVTSAKLKQDNQKFLSPILFVDGHASQHDFTKAIKNNPLYPLEPTANWIWYKTTKD